MMKTQIRGSCRYEPIVGSRRLSNYIWTLITFLGGSGFLLAGLSSYFKVNLLPVTDSTKLIFIPQGIVLIFYGAIGFILSIFLFLSLVWDIGSGYNKYDRETNKIIIFRKGFPGKNREISLEYTFEDIKEVQLEIIDKNFDQRRNIFLNTLQEEKIPLIPENQPLLLSQREENAIELAQFLNVPIRTYVSEMT